MEGIFSMKKWKSILAGLSCLSTLLAAGCIPVIASDEIPEQSIIYWSMWEEDEPQAEVIREAADAYQEATGISVEIQWKGREIRSLIGPALDAGEEIDLFDDDYQRMVQEHGIYLTDLKKIAASVDYRPNVVARGLAQRKTYNIALLMPKDYVATEFLFFKDCMNGICEIASAHDYDIIISMVDGEDVSQIERLEANRKVDGIIVSRAVVSSRIQKYLKTCREPFVLIGPTNEPDVPFVDNKNQEAGKELTSIMLMKGMRRLALLGGNESYNVTGSRYQGFLDAHQELGIPVDKNLIFMNADNQLVVSDAVSKLYEAGADGIVCMDDVICSMCMSSLREKKIQVPMQMKIASMYDSKNLEYHNPPVTSIKFDTTGLGQMACIKLLEILGENPQEEIKPLNYQVILRESTQ